MATVGTFSYREWQPPIAAVDSIWSLEVRDGPPRPYQVIADGRVDLLYRGRRERGGAIVMVDVLGVHCAHTGQTAVPQPGDVFVGVRLKAGWAASCPVATSESDDRGLVDASAKLAGLQEETDLLGVARRMLAAVEHHSVTPSRRALLIGSMLSGERPIALDVVARRLRLSARSIRRDISAAFGCSPKELARVMRFQRALRACRSGDRLRLADLAIEHGYSDQAHMTREFRHFGNMTPGRPRG